MNRRELLQRITMSSLVSVIPFSSAVADRTRLKNARSLTNAGLDVPAVELIRSNCRLMAASPLRSSFRKGRLSSTSVDPGRVFENVMWFSVFPTVETLSGQALAGLLVFGSYLTAQPFAGLKGANPTNQ
jgi:hypothetical protein